MELDKLLILALAAETSFLLFKEQVPLKFNKEISAVQCERKPFPLISLSTHVSFRWTVPLKLLKCKQATLRYTLERTKFPKTNRIFAEKGAATGCN
jgi:hypothetical protein